MWFTKFVRKINTSIILSCLLVISLLGIFVLRVYAIYDTVAIRTWDDAGYRKYALKAASENLGLLDAIKDLIFPNAHILDHTRSIGYHSWIVLGLKLSLSGNSEQAFQLSNLGLFVIQAIIIFFFTHWATKNKLFSGTLTFLYLSSPIVLGLNRWVMTENFVMAGLLIFGFIPAVLLSQNYLPFYRRELVDRRELLIGLFLAWMMGIFGSLREYAVPSYVLTSLGTISALIWEKRWDALMGFATIFLMFFGTLLGGWIELWKFVAFRSSQSQYYHTLSEWVPHVILNVIGVPLSLLFLIGCLFFARKTYVYCCTALQKNDGTFNFTKPKVTGLKIIWITNGGLTFLYCLLILLSANRVARSAIVPMFSLLNFCLISIKVFRIHSTIFQNQLMRIFCILLIVCSWSITYYQLFIAFDGGKTFAHPAYGLEYYNYPLHLRQLLSPDDMHVK